MVIFDLDGTLLDTVGDLAGACNDLLAAHGWPQHEVDEYYYFVGNGINKLIERALPHDIASAEAAAALRPEFVGLYQSRITRLTKPYEGIRALLRELRSRGLKLAVASNKYQEGTCELVSHFFADVEFCAVFGQREGIPVKPDPAVVREIMALTGTEPCETLYVGDSGVDMQTARNAGIQSAGVTWGFRPRAELESCGACHIIDRPGQILELV